ncbi:myosin-11-like [Littorina saxatilis]|uniref:myosin-11-like n=1 Tax=Littorina saxatilis TaxID=31220 RepID=UPI0038B4BCA1
MASLKRYPLPFQRVRKLVYAVVNGDLEYVRSVVPKQVNVNQAVIPYPGGASTYLAFIAVDHNKPEALEYLIEHGLDSSVKDRQGMNLFCKVANMPHISKEFTDKLFVEQNGSLNNLLNDQTASGNTAVHLAVSNLYTLTAMLRMTDELRVATIRNIQGDTALALAIKTGGKDNPTVATMLAEYAMNVSHEPLSTTDRDGYTPIELAGMYGITSLVRLLTSGRRRHKHRTPSPQMSRSMSRSTISVASARGSDDEEGSMYEDEMFVHKSASEERLDNGGLVAEIIRLQETNERLQAELDDIVANIPTGRISEEDCNLAVDNTKRLLKDEMDQMRSDLETVIEKKDAHIVELTRTLGNYPETEKLREKIRDLEKNKDALVSDRNTLGDMFTEVNNINEHLKDNLAKKDEELAAAEGYRSELTDQQALLMERVKLASATIMALRATVDTLREDVDTLWDSVDGRNQLVDELQDTIASKDREIEMIRESAEGDAKDLTRKIAGLRAVVAEKSEAASAHGKLLNDQKARISALQVEVEALQDDVADQEDVIREKDEEKGALADVDNKKIGTLEARLAKFGNLETALRATKQELAAAKDESITKNEVINDLKYQLGKHAQVTAGMRNKLDEMKGELTGRTRDIQKRLDEQTRELADRYFEIKTLREERSDCDLEIKTLRQELDGLDLERANLREELDGRNREIQESQASVQALTAKVEKQTSSLSEAMNKKFAIEKDLVTAENTVASLEDDKETHKKALGKAIKDHNDYMTRTVLEIETREKQIQTLEGRLRTVAGTKNQLEEVTSKLDVANGKVANLTGELESLKKDYARQLKDAKDEAGADIKKVKNAYKEQLDAVNEAHEQNLNMIKTKLAAAKSAFDKQIAEYEQECETALEEEMQRNKKVVEEMKQDHQIEIDNLKEQHKDALEDIYKTCTDEISDSNRMRQIRQLKQELMDLEDATDVKMRAAESHHQAELRELLDKIEALKRDNSKLKRCVEVDALTSICNTVGIS